MDKLERDGFVQVGAVYHSTVEVGISDRPQTTPPSRVSMVAKAAFLIASLSISVLLSGLLSDVDFSWKASFLSARTIANAPGTTRLHGPHHGHNIVPPQPHRFPGMSNTLLGPLKREFSMSGRRADDSLRPHASLGAISPVAEGWVRSLAESNVVRKLAESPDAKFLVAVTMVMALGVWMYNCCWEYQKYLIGPDGGSRSEGPPKACNAWGQPEPYQYAVAYVSSSVQGNGYEQANDRWLRSFFESIQYLQASAGRGKWSGLLEEEGEGATRSMSSAPSSASYSGDVQYMQASGETGPKTSTLQKIFGKIFRTQPDVTIERVTQEQLFQYSAEYVAYDVSKILVRGIFPESGEDVIDQLETYIEGGIQSGYNRAPFWRNTWVAKDKDTQRVVGCVSVSTQIFTNRVGYESFYGAEVPNLESLAVDPAYQGQGIAGKLVKTVELYAKEKGFKEVVLQVFEANTRAIRFYKKQGYKVMGEDGSIKRPSSAYGFGWSPGVRWNPSNHLIMSKKIYSFSELLDD